MTINPDARAIQPEDLTTVVGVLSACGEVDLATAPLLSSALEGLLSNGHVHLVVDLAEVTFMDCAGLRALLEARQVATDMGGSISVTNPQAPVRRFFELTQMDQVFMCPA